MSSEDPSLDRRVLYLQQIDTETRSKTNIRVKLLIDNGNIDVERTGRALTWTPSRGLEIPPTCQLRTIIKARHTVIGVPLGRMEATTDLSGQEIAEAFWNSDESDFTLSRQVMFNGEPTTVIFKFRPSTASKSTHVALRKLQHAMKNFRSFMADSTQQHIDVVSKYAVALSEMNSFAKAAVAVASTTFELLKEAKRFDDVVMDLANRVERILPFVERIEEEALYDEANGVLSGAVKMLYDVILDTAEFISGYACQSALKRTVNYVVSLQDQKMIAALVRDLDRLKVDFDRAVGVESLRATKKIESFEEIRFLQSRLRPVEAGYSLERCCMPDTRQAILDNIVTWALRPFEENATKATPKMFWLYGIPGLGKTSVANSICAQLYQHKSLGGSFFCRRDDPNLCEPRHTLPRLIYDLAGMWRPYRRLVTKKLKEDPLLSLASESRTLFSKLLKELQDRPKNPLVLVIDALDECGNALSRGPVLKSLSEACLQLSWLRIVITSRHEQDIETFFQRLDSPDRYLSRDLGMDEQTQVDIALFAQARLLSVAIDHHLNDWPGEKILAQVVQQAGGLFIYVETVWRLVKDEPDPEEALMGAILETSGDVLRDLYKLYSSAIQSRVGKSKEAFRRMIGVVIVTASHRSLCDKSIAILTRLQTSTVQTLVDRLSSLLYRDNKAKDGIRVRHISIIDFLTGLNCPPEFQVNIREANLDAGTGCLTTMIEGLKFNICELETSLVSNEDVKDLKHRVESKISDTLQYSCIHWASHICAVPYSASIKVAQELNKFFDESRPLYWIEALSVMGKIAAGVQALRDILTWAKDSDDIYVGRISDTLQFLLNFYTPITTSAPHIYISALPFMPPRSEIWRHAVNSFKNLIVVKKGRVESWPARPESWSGHSAAVRCIAFSPDGWHAVSGGSDASVRLWDVATGKMIGGPWWGHRDWVEGVAYSPDGRRVVSCSGDCTLRMWDVETRRPIGQPWKAHGRGVNCLAYSPDGRHVISGSEDRRIRIWDTDTGDPIGWPWNKHTESVLCVAYSPDGRYAVSGSRDNTIRKWDPSTGDPVGEPWLGHTESVTCIVYSPDGGRIISSSKDRTIRVWDAEIGNQVGGPWKDCLDIVNSLAYSPDGLHIISASDNNTLQMWDVGTGTTVGMPWKGHSDSVICVSYSPHGRYVISGSRDNSIRIWDTKTGGAADKSKKEYTHSIDCVAYSPDNRHIVSSLYDGAIQIWDVKTGAPISEPGKSHSRPVLCVAYSPDGHQIVSGSQDGTIQVWDALTFKAIGELLRGHEDYVNSVKYSPDGRCVISGSSDHTIRLWDTEGGKPIGEPWKGHESGITSVAYSPDGRYVVSGSKDKTLRIWEVESGMTVIGPWKGHTQPVWSVAYSPDGRHIISGSGEHGIRMWDAQTGSPVGEPWRGHMSIIYAVAYSPDGRHVVSGSSDETIRLWDPETGRTIGDPWKGHKNKVVSISFSPNGQHVVSGSHDHTIRIWDVYPARGEQLINLLGEESLSKTTSSPHLNVNLLPNDSGWVHHSDGGLLFWVPEDYREGLVCRATVAIPPTGPHRAVQLDFTDFRYGTSWGELKEVKT